MVAAAVVLAGGAAVAGVDAKSEGGRRLLRRARVASSPERSAPLVFGVEVVVVAVVVGVVVEVVPLEHALVANTFAGTDVITEAVVAVGGSGGTTTVAVVTAGSTCWRSGNSVTELVGFTPVIVFVAVAVAVIVVVAVVVGPEAVVLLITFPAGVPRDSPFSPTETVKGDGRVSTVVTELPGPTELFTRVICTGVATGVESGGGEVRGSGDMGVVEAVFGRTGSGPAPGVSTESRRTNSGTEDRAKLMFSPVVDGVSRVSPAPTVEVAPDTAGSVVLPGRCVGTSSTDAIAAGTGFASLAPAMEVSVSLTSPSPPAVVEGETGAVAAAAGVALAVPAGVGRVGVGVTVAVVVAVAVSVLIEVPPVNSP